MSTSTEAAFAVNVMPFFVFFFFFGKDCGKRQYVRRGRYCAHSLIQTVLSFMVLFGTLTTLQQGQSRAWSGGARFLKLPPNDRAGGMYCIFFSLNTNPALYSSVSIPDTRTPGASNHSTGRPS
ncbi:hypothetical protein CPB85DRAFT_1296703 [Mucidula mucida]|nr:hypothetical protein CPB85DRAFT_1296703 [Mucidula mucida]